MKFVIASVLFFAASALAAPSYGGYATSLFPQFAPAPASAPAPAPSSPHQYGPSPVQQYGPSPVHQYGPPPAHQHGSVQQFATSPLGCGHKLLVGCSPSVAHVPCSQAPSPIYNGAIFGSRPY